MKHAELKELLPLYIDGGLEKDEVKIVESHISECEECREELKAYQQNFDFLSSIEELDVGDEFLQTLLNRIEAEEKVNSKSKKQISWLNRFKELLSFRLRIPVGALGVFAAALILVLMVGVFNNYPYENKTPNNISDFQDNGVAYESLPKASYGLDQSKLRSTELNAESLDADLAQNEQKIIQTAYMSVEVKDLKSAENNIANLIQDLNGFISNSSKWLASNNRHVSSFTLRIPEKNFSQAITRIEELGKIISHSTSGRDVTEEYIDVDSRLKNLVLQEERYRQLLNKAVNVEDILKIERELERVRSTIESLQGRLNYLDDQISLSTINVELKEPVPITSSDNGIINAFREALRKMVETFYRLIVGLGVLIPYLVVIIIILIILYWVVRRRR